MVLAAQALSYGKPVPLRMLAVFCRVGADLLCVYRSIVLSFAHVAGVFLPCSAPASLFAPPLLRLFWSAVTRALAPPERFIRTMARGR